MDIITKWTYYINTITTTTTVLWPPGLCPGLPRWAAGTRKVKQGR